MNSDNVVDFSTVTEDDFSAEMMRKIADTKKADKVKKFAKEIIDHLKVQIIAYANNENEYEYMESITPTFADIGDLTQRVIQEVVNYFVNKGFIVQVIPNESNYNFRISWAETQTKEK